MNYIYFFTLLLIPFIIWIRRYQAVSVKIEPLKDQNAHTTPTEKKERVLQGGEKFQKIYGYPVHVTSAGSFLLPSLPIKPWSISHQCHFISSKLTTIAPSAVIDHDLVVENILRIGENTHLKKSVKCFKDLYIEPNVVIEGSVFCEGNVVVGKNVKILGSLFSQKKAYLGDSVQIGHEDTEKSLIAYRGIHLSQGVKVFGFIMTKGSGNVCGSS